MCKPGVTCGEVAEAFFGTLQKRGFHKDSRAGYSIGLSYPPDWGERTLSIRRGDKTVLEPNMTLHFMPALWLDDGGLELSETILITRDRRRVPVQDAAQAGHQELRSHHG